MRRVLFLFGELDDSDIDWLGSAGRVTSLASDEFLITAGTRPSQIAILLDGELAVSLPTQPPTELARLLEGEIVGELTFLDPRPPLTNVAAVAPSIVLQVPHRAILMRLSRDDAFGVRFYRGLGVFLASRLRETTGRLGVRSGKAGSDEHFVEADELDDESMERTALAARRFEFLRAKLGLR